MRNDMKLSVKSATFVLFILCLGVSLVRAQNEQAPIVEREIAYQDWTYKNIRTGENINLREFARNKKLVMVVYYAPWCGNWRFDSPILKRFHEKYAAAGLGIIAVGNYDPLDSMKANLEEFKTPFPAVYEAAERNSRQSTLHYKYRTSTGDTRKWGSPWYIFLDTAQIEKSGDTLIRKTQVVNGEVIESEGERFIRQKLGLAENKP